MKKHRVYLKIALLFARFQNNDYLCTEINNHRAMMSQSMQNSIANYFKTQPVVKAWVFGSFARGEETPLSDVDLLVVLDHSTPLGLKFFGMWNDLEKLLNRDVDLVEEGTLSPFAIESANRDKKLIYERTA